MHKYSHMESTDIVHVYTELEDTFSFAIQRKITTRSRHTFERMKAMQGGMIVEKRPELGGGSFRVSLWLIKEVRQATTADYYNLTPN